jgi:hypothetical protein
VSPVLDCSKSANRRNSGDNAVGWAAVTAKRVCPAAIAICDFSDTTIEGQCIFAPGQPRKDRVKSGAIAGT